MAAARFPPLFSRRVPLLLALLLLLLLGGCSAVKGYLFGPPTAKVASVRVEAEREANQNTATALDLVFVYDNAVVALLPRNGPDWFRQKGSLLISLGKDVDVLPVSIAPGLSTGPLALPKRHKDALAVFAYANYLSADGQPVANLTAYGQVLIRLGRDTVTYSDQ